MMGFVRRRMGTTQNVPLGVLAKPRGLCVQAQLPVVAVAQAPDRLVDQPLTDGAL